MARYTKKAVTIEAVDASLMLFCASHAWSDLPPWLVEAYEKGGIVFAADHISISTLEGVHRADRGDMIIRGVKGELYPCKPDIFAATYDDADAAADEAKRETTAIRMAETNRVLRLLAEEGIDERVLERVRNEVA
jgi:hypothetical protein